MSFKTYTATVTAHGRTYTKPVRARDLAEAQVMIHRALARVYEDEPYTFKVEDSGEETSGIGQRLRETGDIPPVEHGRAPRRLRDRRF